MPTVRRLVLDVLKPHDPPLLAFTEALGAVESVDATNVSLVELDNEVQNVTAAVEGEDLDFDAVDEAIRELGGTVHSVDQAACGAYVVEERPTPQDR